MIILWILLAIVVVFGVTALTGAPYVPSKRRDIRVAFRELYPLGVHDTLVDIGSGDGVVLREAARHGARSIGYEINPILVVIARMLSYRYPHADTRMADFWRMALPSETTVVYTFGDGRDIKKMAKKVESEATRLGKELFLISYGFAVPGYTPEKEVGAHKLYRLKPLQAKKP